MSAAPGTRTTVAATSFFARQDKARRSTLYLLVMFCLATVVIVIAVSAVVAVATSAAAPPDEFDGNQLALPILAGVGTLMLILGGSFFKVVALRAGGGAAVAESLGGIRLFPNSTDPVERRLLNVVEEMAIASGVPVPPVYFLAQEQGINAFAAGYSTSDAVLGVTRGCAEQLTREELQGVLAHEFSHILNGDMRIGIRVMGVLYGILLMGLVGQLIFRTVGYGGQFRSRNDDKSGNPAMAIMLIGLGLIVLGFIGTFLGNLIKAAISRQRERLADASGVQFTRNPAGLAGALKRIGAIEAGSQLRAPNAAQASHIFFAEGVWKNMAGLWSSHPPLEERIRELDPSWDGKFPVVGSSNRIIANELAHPSTGASSFVGSADEIPVHIVDHAVEHVGNPTMAHVNYAAEVRPLIPDAILSAARTPYSARAIVFTLLLNQDNSIRAQQIQSLRELVTPDLVALVQQLMPAVDQLDPRVRLPLVDLSLPALAAMSQSQYAQFIEAFKRLALADGQLDLFEWVLSQIVIRHLRPRFENSRPNPVVIRPLPLLSQSCSVVLSAVAYGGNSDSKASRAFASAVALLPELRISLQSRDRCDLPALRQSLADLTQASSKDQGRIVNACATSISADGHATIEEVELLRGISDLLDCPMPPLLPKVG